jgi:hypothetical protein
MLNDRLRQNSVFRSLGSLCTDASPEGNCDALPRCLRPCLSSAAPFGTRSPLWVRLLGHMSSNRHAGSLGFPRGGVYDSFWSEHEVASLSGVRAPQTAASANPQWPPPVDPSETSAPQTSLPHASHSVCPIPSAQRRMLKPLATHWPPVG